MSINKPKSSFFEKTNKKKQPIGRLFKKKDENTWNPEWNKENRHSKNKLKI